MGSEFSARTLKMASARAGGRCEGCGRVEPLQAHHRKYRSRGGDGSLSNCILLCGLGNSSGCHGLAHSDGAGRGWALSRGDDPEQVPVFVHRFGYVLVLFKDDGTVRHAGRGCWVHMERPVGECVDCVPAGSVLWDYEKDKGL